MKMHQKSQSDGEEKPSCWLDLSDTDRVTALKKGYDECGGRYMELSGQYLGNIVVTIYGVGVALSTNFLLSTAACLTYLDHDLEGTSEALHFFVMISNQVAVVISFLRNRRTIDDLFTAIGAGFYSYGDTVDAKSQKEMNDLIAGMKKRKTVRMKVFYLLVWACGFVLIAKLILNQFRFKDWTDGEGGTPTKKLTAPLWFYGVDQWSGYIFICYLCYSNQVWMMTAMWGTMLPIIAICEEIAAQLELVGIGLRRLKRRAKHLFVKRYQSNEKNMFRKCVEETLRASIRHHILVLEMSNQLRQLLMVPLLSMMIIVSILLCMQGFVLIEDSVPVWIKIGSTTFICSEVIYAFLLSAYGDSISSASYEIGNKLYEDDWFQFSNLLRPYYAIIKLRSCKPVRLSACGFVDVDYQAFSTVLNSAYSYMNLMLSSKQ